MNTQSIVIEVNNRYAVLAFSELSGVSFGKRIEEIEKNNNIGELEMSLDEAIKAADNLEAYENKRRGHHTHLTYAMIGACGFGLAKTIRAKIAELTATA